MRGNFIDVICGFIDLNATPSQDDVCFQKISTAFEKIGPHKAQTIHRGPGYGLISSSKFSDFHENEQFVSLFAGFASGLTSADATDRRISRHFSTDKKLSPQQFTEFIDSRFSGVRIDKKAKQIDLISDFFGKRKLFYTTSGSVLYFSSRIRDLHFLDLPYTFDRQALRTYLSMDVVLGDRTFFNEIRTTPLQGFVSAKLQDGQVVCTPHSFKTEWPGFVLAKGSLEPHQVIEKFQRAVGFYFDDFNFKSIDLSGGADTRFTLATVMKMKKDFSVFTNPDRKNYSVIDYLDRVVADLLMTKFSLQSVLENKATSFVRYDRPLATSDRAFSRHYVTDDDYYQVHLSSMAGGEVFGGLASYYFLSAERIAKFGEQEQHMHTQFPTDFFAGTISWQQEFQQETDRLIYENPGFLLSIYLNSTATNMYLNHSDEWFEPHILGARKLSAYLSDVVLGALNDVDIVNRVSGCKLYHELYQVHMTDFKDVPFNSRLAKQQKAHYPHIEDFISLLPNKAKQATEMAVTSSASTEEQRLFKNKLDLLNQWLAVFSPMRISDQD